MFVFVYGTLMLGEYGNQFLEGATFLGTDKIEGFQIVQPNYVPHAVPGQGALYGELYRVPKKLEKEILQRLDAYEGPAYNRVTVKTATVPSAEVYISKYQWPTCYERYSEWSRCLRP